MNMQLTAANTGSFVFITGAAGGLGKAFSLECAARGWDLFLTDLSGTALPSLSEGLTHAYGVRVLWRAADLTDNVSRSELYDYLRENGLSFRFLINVAGLDYEGAFSERQPEQIRTLIRLNIEANLETTYAILALRDPTVPFRIINVASLAAFYPMPLKAMYASSKRFILHFSLALREELRSSRRLSHSAVSGRHANNRRMRPRDRGAGVCRTDHHQKRRLCRRKNRRPRAERPGRLYSRCGQPASASLRKPRPADCHRASGRQSLEFGARQRGLNRTNNHVQHLKDQFIM